MPKLGIAKDFLAEYARLQKPVQRAVDAAIAKFSQHTHAGLHQEKLVNAKDEHIRGGDQDRHQPTEVRHSDSHVGEIGRPRNSRRRAANMPAAHSRNRGELTTSRKPCKG